MDYWSKSGPTTIVRSARRILTRARMGHSPLPLPSHDGRMRRSIFARQLRHGFLADFQLRLDLRLQVFRKARALAVAVEIAGAQRLAVRAIRLNGLQLGA